MSKSYLVLPDAHVTPDHNNSRFELLSKFIAARRPDVILCLGDFSDVNSLSSYDKGKRIFVGRRFTLDCEAAVDAQDKMFADIKTYNVQRKVNKEKQYRPKRIMLLGNHENRIERAIDLSPELEGLLSVDKFEYDKYWDMVVPFKQPLELDNIIFSHFIPSGVMGSPISGFNVGRLLLDKCHQSTVVGHSHLFDCALSTKANGQRIWGIAGGCFLDEDQVPTYAADTSRLWWRGIMYFHNVENGDFDLEIISMKTLRKTYG